MLPIYKQKKDCVIIFFEKPMEENQAKQLSPIVLAYLGDAVYELMVREHLLKSGAKPASKLHRSAIGLVCADAQCGAAECILPRLSEEERSVYLRGRNAKSQSIPKNADIEHYKKATGLECLFGYLYLTENKNRLDFLFSLVLKHMFESY